MDKESNKCTKKVTNVEKKETQTQRKKQMHEERYTDTKKETKAQRK